MLGREIDNDALDGYSTIDSWQNANGRGFWGNPTTGFIDDCNAND